ncbi:MAG: hypothetical protein PHG03_04880 [Bacilli bacterium]|nr:hypothetical protein [Bacilli bacterium]MDD4795870.1 hypothetical protein [Bacilli bacterium]
MNNKEYVIIKGKINVNLDNVFKLMLKNLNMTKQDFIEKSVLEFVAKNVFLVIKKEDQKDRD